MAVPRGGRHRPPSPGCSAVSQRPSAQRPAAIPAERADRARRLGRVELADRDVMRNAAAPRGTATCRTHTPPDDHDRVEPPRRSDRRLGPTPSVEAMSAVAVPLGMATRPQPTSPRDHEGRGRASIRRPAHHIADVNPVNVNAGGTDAARRSHWELSLACDPTGFQMNCAEA